MAILLQVVKACAILAAAGVLGNWFLKEVRTGKQKGLPWYAAYLSPPGLLIICIICLLPLLAWWLRQ